MWGIAIDAYETTTSHTISGTPIALASAVCDVRRSKGYFYI